MVDLRTTSAGWGSVSHLQGLLAALRIEESKLEKQAQSLGQKLAVVENALGRVHEQRQRVLRRISEIENAQGVT